MHSERKILSAAHAPEHGHLARAKEVLPCLENYGEVDLIVAGTKSEWALPAEPRYRLEGVSFTFGKTGGKDYRSTTTVLVQGNYLAS